MSTPPKSSCLSAFAGLFPCFSNQEKPIEPSTVTEEPPSASMQMTEVAPSLPASSRQASIKDTESKKSLDLQINTALRNSSEPDVLKAIQPKGSPSTPHPMESLMTSSIPEDSEVETFPPSQPSKELKNTTERNSIDSSVAKKGRSRQTKQMIHGYELSSRPLGSGTFAVVYKATCINDGVSYALKFVDRNILKRLGKTKDFIEREVETLKRMKHKNIISLHDVFKTKDSVVLVTDFAHGGELLNRFYDSPDFTEQDAVKITRQLLEGVAYLHSEGIIHRDIKPENLLLKNWTDKIGDAHLLIADFGLARALTSVHESLATACGTPHFVAPEIMLGRGYSKPVDIWSCGVVVYFLLSGYTPFEYDVDPSSIREMEKTNIFADESWREVSSNARSLVRGLLRINPTKRPSAIQALTHPWLAPDGASATNLLARAPTSPASQKRMKRAMVKLKAFRNINEMTKNPNEASN